MTTTYERRGDQYVLNGVKYLISNGGIADAVDLLRLPGEAARRAARGASPRSSWTPSSPGFEAENLTAKMGMPRPTPPCSRCENAEVPLENLLGAEGDGFRVAMGTLVSGRLSVAAGCLGVIEDCLAEVVELRQGAAAARQADRQAPARAGAHRAHRDAPRGSDAMVMKAAEAKDAATAHPDDKELARQADMLAAQAKFFATNAAWDAADRAVQVFGGRGWSTLYRPGRHLMDVRVCRIYEGTDEILKLKIAAGVLGKEFEAFK